MGVWETYRELLLVDERLLLVNRVRGHADNLDLCPLEQFIVWCPADFRAHQWHG